MADTYGLVTLPIAPATIGPDGLPSDSVSDKLIDVTLDFFQHYINRYATDAWQSVMPNSLPVAFVSINDPEEAEEFNERQLPCLFAWRAGTGDQAPDHLAEDIWLMRDTIDLLWVFPPARQKFSAFRGQIVSGLSKLLHVAIEQGQDPSWVYPGDPDPRSTAEGSVFPRIAGWVEMNLSKWSSKALVVPITANDERHYSCLGASLDVVEEFDYDVTRFGANSLDQKIYDATNTLLVDRRIIPAP
jgi:hypothetical protein